MKVLGEENIHTAQTYYNIGLVHECLGQFNITKDYFKKALSIILN